ncbi:MAG: CHAP domain-containing protein [Acidimicrobiales bacterium]
MAIARGNRSGNRSRVGIVSASAIAIIALSAVGALHADKASGSVAVTHHALPYATKSVPGIIDVLCAPNPGYKCTSSTYNPLVGGTYDPLVSGGDTPGVGSGWVWSDYGPNWATSNASGYHNCTLYVAYVLQLEGVDLSWSDNAGPSSKGAGWAKDATANPKDRVDQAPTIGAVAQWNGNGVNDGHVGFVTNYVPGAKGVGYIDVVSDNLNSSNGGYTDKFRIFEGSPYWPDNFIHFDDLYQNDRIIRESSGSSWVITDGMAHPITDGGTYYCAEYRRGYPVVAIGSLNPLVDLPAGAPFSCNFDGSVLLGSGASTSTAYWYQNNQPHIIVDQYSLEYYESKGPTINVPLAVINSLKPGSDAPLELLARNLPANSIVQDGTSWKAGESWVVRSGVRQPIPYIQDDVCWRDKDSYQVVSLAPTQIADIPLGSTTGDCLIGPAIVTSTSGAVYYVDNANNRHWIPDNETLQAIESGMTPAVSAETGVPDQSIPNLGTWPEVDVSDLPPIQPADMAAALNWHDYSGDIVEGDDGSSWVVTSNGMRRSIPYAQDFVCWHDKVGMTVAATGLQGSQIDSLVEGQSDPCIIGPAVVTAQGGASYFVDLTNTRYWIPDIPTYWLYANSNPVYAWPAADVADIPQGSNLADPFIGKIINSPKNNAYFVGTNSKLYYIPGGVGGAVYSCLVGPGHDVSYYGSVTANIVDNFDDSEGFVASCS